MNKEVLKRIIKYMGKGRVWLLLSLLSALVSVILTLYIPILTGRAVDLIVGKGNVDFKKLAGVHTTILVAVLVTALAQWVMSVCNNRMTYHVVRDIRKDAFEKIKHLPLSYLDVHPSGDIVSRMISDVDQLADGLLMGFSQLFTGALTIIGTLIFMLTVQPLVTLVVVLITPLSLFAASFIAKHTYDMFRVRSETNGEQTGLIDEMVGDQKTVQAFSQEENMIARFDEINKRLKDCSLRAIFYSSLVNPVTRFVNSLVYAGVGVFGAILGIKGIMTVGMLTSFLSYANQYTKPFNEISGVITELQNAFACAKRVFDLIDEQEESMEADKVLHTDGSISIDNISFSYDKKKPLIENFSLDVKPGQRIAIVGPTGCGKTTFINLLMRFYDVDSGTITVAGENIKDVTRGSLRTSYGMVLQDTWLKSGTIRDNIAFAKPEADEEEIISAAKAAHAHSFIKRLPNGYDTLIGENGGNLSQGQKQLLCIARAMLSLPQMLILDEATSSIDTRTEVRIQKAFATMMEGRTSFIVAHRLSTIRSADVILVMNNGHIIEKGTHEELLLKKGFYAEMYRNG